MAEREREVLTLRLTKAALGDLRQIWNYVALDSEDAADRLVEQLYETLAWLAEYPAAGHTRTDLTQKLRILFWAVRNYLTEVCTLRKGGKRREIAVFGGISIMPPLCLPVRPAISRRRMPPMPN